MKLFRGMEKENIGLNSRRFGGICKICGRKIKKHLHRTSMYGVQRNREVFRIEIQKKDETDRRGRVRPFCTLEKSLA